MKIGTTQSSTHIQITDKKLVRDRKSRAVLNTDLEAFGNYKERKITTSKLNAMEKEMTSIKDTLSHILKILQVDKYTKVETI